MASKTSHSAKYTPSWRPRPEIFALLVLVGVGLAGCERAKESLLARLQGKPSPTYLPEPPKVEGPAIGIGAVPMEPPFVGELGTDAAGYPLRHPDKAALLNLLRLKRFDLLDKFITYYQEQYEADYHNERWPADVANAFNTADPAFEPLLEQWLQHSPNTFPALFARGLYKHAVGWHMRGAKFSKDTSDAQMAALKEYSRDAEVDLKRALELHPKLQAARHYLILIGKATSAAPVETRKILDAGLAQCRLCYGIRSVFMSGLQPRWHGSWKEMDEFASESFALIKENPKLELLRGASAADQCDVFHGAKKFKEAHAACADALRYGDEVVALTEQAQLFVSEERHLEALASLERAVRADPQNENALRLRQQVRTKTGDYLGAARDLIQVRHLEPTDSWVAERVTWLVKQLTYEGSKRFKEGKASEAAPYFQLGLELDPDNVDLMRRQGWAAQGDVAALLAEAATRPDDFELRLRIDHALATKRQFDQVVEMWDVFIVAHPQDPRPLAERGGAKWHLGKRDDAIADMNKACALGMQKACNDALRMQGSR
jgi:tetratricopeptide (TPR) repeat protein